MKVAIYVRRSTEEHQEESLKTQLESARRYIAERLPARLGTGACTVSEEHVYVDDAVSRAEFKNREGLFALLNAAKRGDFEVVVTRDETRIGGDMHRTGLVMQDLIDYGVQLVYYHADEVVQMGRAVDKILVAVRNFASEYEREKIAERTRENHESKARRGLNTGGRCYGYDNVRGPDGVRYVVNEEQATVVRLIYQLFADGLGNKAIAKELNQQGIPSPTTGRRGSGSWSPSCIREMLRRPRYRGISEWGKKGKEYRSGTRIRVDKPESQLVRVEAPDLQIVPDVLVRAVDELIETKSKFTGRAGAAGPRAKYLFSGLAKCGQCGGGIQATNCGGRTKRKVYVCSWHRNRGREVCDNATRPAVAAVDSAVLEWIADNVLSEELVLTTLATLRERLGSQGDKAKSEWDKLRGEQQRLKQRISRLTCALASTEVSPRAVIEQIAADEKRATEIEVALTVLAQTPVTVENQLAELEREARARLGHFKGLLKRNPEHAREAMEKLLNEPLRFSPVPGTKHINVEGLVSNQALFTTVGDPTGT